MIFANAIIVQNLFGKGLDPTVVPCNSMSPSNMITSGYSRSVSFGAAEALAREEKIVGRGCEGACARWRNRTRREKHPVAWLSLKYGEPYRYGDNRNYQWKLGKVGRGLNSYCQT
jgi:hypothetical protein